MLSPSPPSALCMNHSLSLCHLHTHTFTATLCWHVCMSFSWSFPDRMTATLAQPHSDKPKKRERKQSNTWKEHIRPKVSKGDLEFVFKVKRSQRCNLTTCSPFQHQQASTETNNKGERLELTSEHGFNPLEHDVYDDVYANNMLQLTANSISI